MYHTNIMVMGDNCSATDWGGGGEGEGGGGVIWVATAHSKLLSH